MSSLLIFSTYGFYAFISVTDVAEAECWVAQVRRREWGGRTLPGEGEGMAGGAQAEGGGGACPQGKEQGDHPGSQRASGGGSASYGGAAREVFSSSTPGHCYHLGLPSLSPDFASLSS